MDIDAALANIARLIDTFESTLFAPGSANIGEIMEELRAATVDAREWVAKGGFRPQDYASVMGRAEVTLVLWDGPEVNA